MIEPGDLIFNILGCPPYPIYSNSQDSILLSHTLVKLGNSSLNELNMTFFRSPVITLINNITLTLLSHSQTNINENFNNNRNAFWWYFG